MAMINSISIKSDRFGAKSMLPEIKHKLADKLSEEYKKIEKSAKNRKEMLPNLTKLLKKTENNSRALTKSRF